MSAIHRGLAACVLGMCCLADATAATVCVFNKKTGQIEPLAANAANARPCAPAPASPPAGGRATPTATVAAGAADMTEVRTWPVDLAGAVQAPVARLNANSKREWILKTDYHTLEEAIEDFAAQVDYEVIYEAREFPLELRRDMTIAKNADFWEALRVLGETYRKSDGAFQILPTKFKQIVVVPMGQEATADQR